MTTSCKIVTWNVNSVKARADHVRRYLQENEPDILFLQELKGEDFPELSSGYHVLFKGQKAYNGVAILSKEPLTLVADKLDGDEEDIQARYLEAQYGALRLINIYLPNGNPTGTDKFPYKLAWMNRLYRRAAALRVAGIPFLIGGDFNVIPEDKDCYDPVLWRGDALYHPETVSRFRSFLNVGLSDAYRVFHPDEHESYTFWDYQAGAWPRNRGLRIDHFLTSPSVTDSLVSCTIDKAPRGWESPSDHTPVVLELQRKRG